MQKGIIFLKLQKILIVPIADSACCCAPIYVKDSGEATPADTEDTQESQEAS